MPTTHGEMKRRPADLALPVDVLLGLKGDGRAGMRAVAEADSWGIEVGSVLDQKKDEVIVAGRCCCVERRPPAVVVQIRLLPPRQVPVGRLKGLADEARASVGLPNKVITVELGENVGSLLAQIWAAAESTACGLLLCIQGSADQHRFTKLRGPVLLVVAGPECVVVQLVERVSGAGEISVDDCPAAEVDVGVGTGGEQVSG